MIRPILVTGAQGQLGRELVAALAAHGDVVAADRTRLDLADVDAIVCTVRDLNPWLVVNAAAYTAVDRAEEERELAYAVNARAPGVLADEAKAHGALLVHYSTDYVFDGSATVPYREDAPTGPLNVYGASKLEGERAILASGANALVLRTSWVYGLTGANFLVTMRRLARERDELSIVADQTGIPNWTRTLATATSRLIGLGHGSLAERSGLYHFSCTGEASWYAFARAILAKQPQVRVRPIATADYPRPAQRPAYAVLASDRFAAMFGFSLPDWQRALADCLASDESPQR